MEEDLSDDSFCMDSYFSPHLSDGSTSSFDMIDGSSSASGSSWERIKDKEDMRKEVERMKDLFIVLEEKLRNQSKDITHLRSNVEEVVDFKKDLEEIVRLFKLLKEKAERTNSIDIDSSHSDHHLFIVGEFFSPLSPYSYPLLFL